jgi:Rieske Fe-S protein
MTAINRRRALAGSAAVAVGVPLLAACGGQDSTSTGSDGSGGSGSSPSDTGGTAGETLATAADVPVGGCFVVSGAKVVVTQPSEGDFKAFTAVCTHQGCLVETSSEGDIPCPCHGSKFSLEDGSPISGPASAPLAAVDITVDGDTITRA